MSEKKNTTAQSTSVLTPYGAAKIVNTMLAEAGLDKRIPSQMMYNYTSGRVNKGKEPFIAWTDKEGIDRKALQAWAEKYVAKQVAAATTDTTPTPAETVEA
jgi:hypothetical protein